MAAVESVRGKPDDSAAVAPLKSQKTLDLWSQNPAADMRQAARRRSQSASRLLNNTVVKPLSHSSSG